ncbi:hypothetical protein [Amycolatopsis thermoflava]|uniref:hypothetical protein n=1 Tax=Amycolatopsis thermoflava TaxID=84480 RepID=UPI003F49D3DA
MNPSYRERNPSAAGVCAGSSASVTGSASMSNRSAQTGPGRRPARSAMIAVPSVANRRTSAASAPVATARSAKSRSVASSG